MRTATAKSRSIAVGEVLLIWAVFFLHAAWPTPEVNEPHYLGKAKHYWDASWCAGDFFLESADAHQVFYWTCGWLTKWMSLDATAWVGRAASWLLLAIGWRRLSTAVIPRPGYAILTAAGVVALNSRLHVAGEWFVGGFEAKGIGYALVFWGWSEIVRNRWRAGLIVLGAATSVHAVIGGWAAIAAGIAWIAAGKRRPPALTMIPAAIISALLTLPGVWPALALNRGADPADIDQANQFYVFERLGHHLLLTAMKPEFLNRFAVMAGVSVVVALIALRSRRGVRLRNLTFATMAICLVGAAISLVADENRSLSASVLRFYWFRLADVAVPACLAIGFARWIVRTRLRHPAAAGWVLLGAIVFCGCHLGDVTYRRRQAPRPPADAPNKVADHLAWRAICREIAKRPEFPPNARFLTPRVAMTFRWYADHPEVVSWKDIPQDATSMVQWWKRLRDIHGGRASNPGEVWIDSLTELSAGELIALGKKYGATFVITDAQPQIVGLREMFANEAYAVYELAPPP